MNYTSLVKSYVYRPDNNDDYQLQLQHPYQNPSSRPGTSLSENFRFLILRDRILKNKIKFQKGVHGSADNAAGASTSGARRVTLQERERQDADAEKRSDYKSMF